MKLELLPGQRLPGLDEPLAINGMRLRNRLAMAPIGTGYVTAEGFATEDAVGFYRQRARHVGLMIVENAAVRPGGRQRPFSLGLWDDEHTESVARLAKVVHEGGATAVLQINHAGARARPTQGDISCPSPSGMQLRPDGTPAEMTGGQIQQFVEDFAAAAVRAAAAGFEGVELHCAHMYLLSQFLSPLTNHRTDRYGGDAAGRAAFPADIVRAIRARLGSSFPILIRLNAIEEFEGGQTLEDSLAAALVLKEAGADGFHASFYVRGSWRQEEGGTRLVASTLLAKGAPSGENAHFAGAIKRATGLPSIAVGKLGDAEAAARVVRDGIADVVAIGRQMIADPDTAGKILEGRSDEIVRCKECLACIASIRHVRVGRVKCATNLNTTGTPRYAHLVR